MNILAIIGLVLDIGGVVMLYIWGPPIPILLPDGSELVWKSENGEKATQKAKIAKRRIFLSKVAMLIIIFGFVLQLIGQFTYNENYKPDPNNYTNTDNNEIKSSEAKVPPRKPK